MKVGASRGVRECKARRVSISKSKYISEARARESETGAYLHKHDEPTQTTTLISILSYRNSTHTMPPNQKEDQPVHLKDNTVIVGQCSTLATLLIHADPCLNRQSWEHRAILQRRKYVYDTLYVSNYPAEVPYIDIPCPLRPLQTWLLAQQCQHRRLCPQ